MQNEQQENFVSFSTDGLILEGLLHRMPGAKAAVVTHPHSLYGGDMYNPVVETICRCYAAGGFSTLRFNFRGVGASQGEFENGCGEARDVLAALDFLKDSGIRKIELLGYSFGARVLAGLENLPKEVLSEIYVAPPAGFMDFSDVGFRKDLRLVVVGEQDEIAQPRLIKKLLPTWNSKAELVVIEDGDHFFSSSMKKLTKILTDRLDTTGSYG
ncbi:MAG: hypothetical protein QNJ17_07160 [Desulfocapsaceae bacterium]|nr:hypothetical protein [Desulfocapsaceae bacterium]